MTDVPVAEAAERLRAALAALDAGEKVKLYPADVRALLEFYDRHVAAAEPAAGAGSEQTPATTDRGEPSGSDNPQLSEITRSLKGIQGALDLMTRSGFDKNLLAVLIPFADAILRLLNREIDEMKRQKVEDTNDAYKALAAAQDDEDEAYHAAMRGRRGCGIAKRDNAS